MTTTPQPVLRAAAAALLLAGCSGGPPRRATPPPGSEGNLAEGPPPRFASQEGSSKAEKFSLRGVDDTWDAAPPVIDALKHLGGVYDAFVDEGSGKIAVLYDPRRTQRETIARRVREVGQELGREYEPIFDDR